jgi:ABC-2 type transport system permease protein
VSSVVSAPVSPSNTRTSHLRPSFVGIVRGEVFKVFHMASFWIMLVLLLCFNAGPYLISLANQTRLQNSLLNNPLSYWSNELSINLGVLRVFIGFFLIILTATVIGREYQLGTIRVLLARGVGRVQLLLAKIAAIVLLAIATLLVCLVIQIIGQLILQLVLTGNFDKLNHLPTDYLYHCWLYLVTILISMGVTILMTAAFSVLGHSMVFGLSAGLAFFPADNIANTFMFLGYELTKNDGWKNITAYFLGPNLNTMPAVLIPASLHIEPLGTAPLVTVDATHTLLVALVYAVIFAAVALIVTWRRDVKE